MTNCKIIHSLRRCVYSQFFQELATSSHKQKISVTEVSQFDRFLEVAKLLNLKIFSETNCSQYHFRNHQYEIIPKLASFFLFSFIFDSFCPRGNNAEDQI